MRRNLRSITIINTFVADKANLSAERNAIERTSDH